MHVSYKDIQQKTLIFQHSLRPKEPVSNC